MPDDADQRYEEIMRRIAQQQAKRRGEQVASSLAEILNALNVVEPLEQFARRRHLPILCYGPTTKKTTHSVRVVVWWMHKGIMPYKELHLFGIWALEQGTSPELIIGMRDLGYTAPVYTAEAFWKLIKRDYTTYYQDDGQPPQGNQILYQVTYEPVNRLTIRQQIQEVIARWQDGLQDGPST